MKRLMKGLVATVFFLVIGLAITIGALYWYEHTVLTMTVDRLKSAVTKEFPDPESSRFRALRLASYEGSLWSRIRAIDVNHFTYLKENGPGALFLAHVTYDPQLFRLCGEVNTKNAFGAYVGYRAFYISGGDNARPFTSWGDGDTFPQRMCEGSSAFVVYSEP